MNTYRYSANVITSPGTQTSRRPVTVYPAHGGRACPPLTREQKCCNNLSCTAALYGVQYNGIQYKPANICPGIPGTYIEY
jgi:hypothetical protein